MVVDMSNDKSLLYYSAESGGVIVDANKPITCKKWAITYSYTVNGREFTESGCDKLDLMSKMLERISAFGFKI